MTSTNLHTLEITYRRLSELRPFQGNARRHSRKQLAQISASIQKFGFTNPVLIADDDQILAGHGRLEAAKLLGMSDIPTVRLSQMTEVDRRAYVIADNKLALNAGWDSEVLAGEMQALIEIGFDVELTGFSLTEIDLTIAQAEQSKPSGREENDDRSPPLDATSVTRPGDVWLLGRHRLLCADARDSTSYRVLMGDERAQLMFTDPPYNVPVMGHVCGLGRTRHREFVMAAGEMTPAQFVSFLTSTLGNGAAYCANGSIAYVCMDWRHVAELSEAGRTVFNELKNICIWNKTNGGMGTFYRSKHEFVFVFKIGDAPHLNTFGLGETGRHRTNVWDYPGVNSPHAGRSSELEMHPTVKPVALVKDAVLDCSRRGGIVLDIFGGSGTTLIAAERTGRTARVIEFDALYCDLIVRRYEELTGRSAKLERTGQEFSAAAHRASAAQPNEETSNA
jgi:DNA modification methylase